MSEYISKAVNDHVGEQGVVLDVSGDELTVSIIRTEACAKCRACLLGLSKEEMILTVKNGCDARKNDMVSIELEANYAIKALFIMYGIPLVFLLASVFLGYYTAQLLGFPQFQELTAVAVGGVGLLLAFFFIKAKDKHIDKIAYTPVAKAVVHRA